MENEDRRAIYQKRLMQSTLEALCFTDDDLDENGNIKKTLPTNITRVYTKSYPSFYQYRANVQARYKGKRRNFYHQSDSMEECENVLPYLKKLADIYRTTGVVQTLSSVFRK